MTKNYLTYSLILLLCFCVQPLHAAFLLEIDTDASVAGNTISFNPRFSYGGDTLSAGASVTSPAYGTTGGNSIFGGDGALLPDTYVYNYSPAADTDNLAIPAGTDLGNGNLASGLPGGGAGTYRVYATWPLTTNVTGGPTRYAVNAIGDFFVTDIDQNNQGSNWILLGEIDYNGSGSISVTQQPTLSNTFVSMRAYGLLFEPVPEPSSFALMGILGLALSFLRRK